MSKTAADFAYRKMGDLVQFEDAPGGLVRCNIQTPLARAQVWLHGAHVALFQPAGAEPVLFLSRQSHFAPGKAIRGGVPVCFPWFGPLAGRPDAPMHGFARTMEWELEDVTLSPAGEVLLTLALTASDATRAHWPHEFILRHKIEIGSRLAMSLIVENRGAKPFTIEEALHTYLAVGDVREVAATGLDHATYLDKTDGFKTKCLTADPLRFTGETDRVFPGHRAACMIDDPILRRRLLVEKSGSDTTVVWNPWTAKAAAMADFGDDEWPQMLCIETANTGANAVTVAPGAQHTMRASVSVG